MPDTPDACAMLVRVIKGYCLDFRSLVSCALHSRPGVAALETQPDLR